MYDTTSEALKGYFKDARPHVAVFAGVPLLSVNDTRYVYNSQIYSPHPVTTPPSLQNDRVLLSQITVPSQNETAMRELNNLIGKIGLPVTGIHLATWVRLAVDIFRPYRAEQSSPGSLVTEVVPQEKIDFLTKREGGEVKSVASSANRRALSSYQSGEESRY